MSEQLDSWKRPIKRKVPVKEDRYQQQLELQLNKTVDATPEEFEKCYRIPFPNKAPTTFVRRQFRHFLNL